MKMKSFNFFVFPNEHFTADKFEIALIFVIFHLKNIWKIIFFLFILIFKWNFYLHLILVYDTKIQQFTTLEAYKVAQNILTTKTPGATISEASGIYKHDDGTVVVEPSLRIEVVGVDRDTVEQIVKELKSVLNQESILVETSRVTISFN
jgi:hypothetical protein